MTCHIPSSPTCLRLANDLTADTSRAALLYAVAIIGVKWALDTYPLSGSSQVFLVLLPTLPLVASVGPMGPYYGEETGEYLRHHLAISIMIGAGFMLAITTIWGSLTDAGLAPHMSSFWAYTLWCMGFGIAQSTLFLRSRIEEA